MFQAMVDLVLLSDKYPAVGCPFEWDTALSIAVCMDNSTYQQTSTGQHNAFNCCLTAWSAVIHLSAWAMSSFSKWRQSVVHHECSVRLGIYPACHVWHM